ncbi:cell division protein FtsL [Brevibacillus fulvus]|uniref:Cell division protein FtsL n=1 Tax=Brevibacillus fulvus TaxID=1125967 RepID=A0A938Y194_9BACL|nr:cell division protein FtsL [Brevibacillus fulvus]
MSYYYRGNLAVDIEQRRPAGKTRRTLKIKSAIPTSEKLLYLFLISVLVFGVSYVGVRYVQISEYNYEIQQLKQQVKKIQDKNTTLQLQVENMSNRERVYAEAQSMNMAPANAESIKVVGENFPNQEKTSEQTPKH